MSEILYEVEFSFDALVLPMVVLLVIGFGARAAVSSGGKKASRPVRLVLWVVLGFVAIGMGVIAHDQIEMYRDLRSAYEHDFYLTVEGPVENYAFRSERSISYESFEIGGVPFAYQSGSLMTGYCRTRDNGGVIYKNGQQLRIGYVPYGGSNVIVCIKSIELS